MDTRELSGRIGDPEDNFVERKPQGLNARDIRRTVVGFANSAQAGREAVLFIGVRDDGRIEGCQNPDKQQMDVRAALKDCYPPITYRCEVLRIEHVEVVAVVVPHSANRPHFSGAAFVRQGSQTVAASDALFNELIVARSSLAAAVLELKDQVVSVIAVQHRLGETRRVVDQGYRQGTDCRVIGCDGHTIRLHDIRSGRNISEPMQHIRLSFDEERQRPLIVVTGY